MPIEFPKKQPSEVEQLPPEAVGSIPTQEKEHDITGSVEIGGRKSSTLRTWPINLKQMGNER